MRQLVGRFVPVADEVFHLQHGDDAEARVFRGFAAEGHYRETAPEHTRQGTYAVTPGGELLASCNTRDPAEMASMLERALERWGARANGEPRQEDAATPPTARPTPPRDGLVLEVLVRDLPRDDLPDDWRRRAWNRDYAWFTREEAAQLVARRASWAAPEIVPAALVLRLARFHLIDCVRGQTESFPAHAIQRAILTSAREKRDGDRIHLVFRGESRARESGRWMVGGSRDTTPEDRERGVEVELLGRAVYDLRARRFVEFLLVGIGERWGGTRFNGRADDLGRTGIGFVLRSTRPEDSVAPAGFAGYAR